MNGGFMIFFIFGIALFIFIFTYVMMIMFSSKARSKMIARQVKSLRGATDMSKEDIEEMLTNLSGASINSKKRIIEENEDTLKDIKDAEARINKDAVRETAGAVKEGFFGSTVSCKQCGTHIDNDSTYCKQCRGEL